ncbi:MAG: cytidine/deoxycytidylate deaminase family protein [Sulfurimonas sp.]|uniref:deoxycytidylate deaminase n=1 Tax=Sulfurimonas sp. TaxID=2022749 RepID=UPI003D0CBD52
MKNKHQFMIEVAQLVSKQSYSEGTKVGAVLEKDGRIIAIGYNGTVRGADNACEEYICANCGASGFQQYPIKVCICCGHENKWRPKDTVVHAEQNVIAFAAKYGISTIGCSLYTTLSPCTTCANLIIQAGIKEVVYAKEWKNVDGINRLRDNGIKTYLFKGD